MPLGCATEEEKPAEPDGVNAPRLPAEYADTARGPAEAPPDYRNVALAEGEAPPDAVAFAFVDHSVITVGEVLLLTVALNHAVGVEVKFPTFRRMNRFEVLPGELVDTEPTQDGRIVSTRRYMLQAFVPGEYRVPSVPVTYIDREGRKRRLRTEGIQVIAASVIPEGAEPTDVIDIKPPKSGVLRFATWVVPAVLGAVVVLAALITLLVFRLRRRAPDRRRPLEAHEMALAELEALRARALLATHAFDPHYVELSNVFRRYLLRRYQMAALNSATEEIGKHLADTPYLGEHTYEVAERFMGETDRVKFARHEPPPPESEATWNDIVYFIDLTRTMAPSVELEGEGEDAR